MPNSHLRHHVPCAPHGGERERPRRAARRRVARDVAAHVLGVGLPRRPPAGRGEPLRCREAARPPLIVGPAGVYMCVRVWETEKGEINGGSIQL